MRPEVTWGERKPMPTDIELEPVTGKALQEFGRYQSVMYNLPKMVSLLVEPWYALVGGTGRFTRFDAGDHLPALPRA